MSDAPDEPVERASQAAKKVADRRSSCEQGHRVGARSREPSPLATTSVEDRFVTEWSYYPDDDAPENCLRSRHQRSQ